MKKVGWCLVTLLVATQVVIASTPGEAIDVLASRLQMDQQEDGSWAEETDWTGTLAAGMVKAGKNLDEPNYLASADGAIDFILAQGSCDYFGDELYAFSLREETKGLAKVFFQLVNKVGMEDYLYVFNHFTDPSTKIFYWAHLTMAAYNVNAADKGHLRNSLRYSLRELDDDADFPVMALGAAVWALANTGPLDNKYIVGTTTKLKDLPGMLASHQVSDGPDAGSFFWRLDHGDGGTGALKQGYTDDSIYGTLGLIAAYESDPKFADLKPAIESAQAALLGGVSVDGTVYEHLMQAGAVMQAYGAKMIQALDACQRVTAEPVVE